MKEPDGSISTPIRQEREILRSPTLPKASWLALNEDLSQTGLFFFFILGPHLQYMEVPRLGTESELEPPAYVTATAMPELSHTRDLHHSAQQRRILNPLSEARDGIHILMDTSRVLNPLSHDKNSWSLVLKLQEGLPSSPEVCVCPRGRGPREKMVSEETRG